MHLSKSKREALRRRFNGCCAYCGETLPACGWHAEAISEEFVQGGIAPVCTSCRTIKGNSSPDEFRTLLAEQVERAMRHSINFRTAMRFGLVSQRAERVEFWYQRCDGVRPDKSDKAQDEAGSQGSVSDRLLTLAEATFKTL